MVASELLESIRAIQAGFVSPDRTVLLASTSRVFTVDEKSAMGDGRVDPERMQEVATYFARRRSGRFRQDGGRGQVPGERRALGRDRRDRRAADRPKRSAPRSRPRQGGGLNLRASGRPCVVADPDAQPGTGSSPDHRLLARHRLGRRQDAGAARGGRDHDRSLRRLLDYRGPRYVQLYLDRSRHNKPNADGALIHELARHLPYA
jgi:indolepyruvate ferredoxin oxidoreductase beta subunit